MRHKNRSERDTALMMRVGNCSVQILTGPLPAVIALSFDGLKCVVLTEDHSGDKAWKCFAQREHHPPWGHAVGVVTAALGL